MAEYARLHTPNRMAQVVHLVPVPVTEPFAEALCKFTPSRPGWSEEKAAAMGTCPRCTVIEGAKIRMEAKAG